MQASTDFNIWWGLLALIPMILYIVLVFRDLEPLPVTILCILVGTIIAGQGLVGLGNMIVKALGSFLAVVGLIIMLGRGLGEVMTATKVTHTIVHKIIYSIGIDTQKKAMLGIGTACFVVIGLLGTMAGGNAILAPIVLPIAASVGLSRSTIGVIFHAVGEEALIIGPFTPPVVTLLGLTGLAYGKMVLMVAVPFVGITLIGTWFNLQKIQRNTEAITPYDVPDNVEKFTPSVQNIRATSVFMILFFSAISYGIFQGAGTSFVVVIMLMLSFAVGFTGGLSLDNICKLIIKGMAGNVGLFLLFLLLEPFILLIETGGGFKALTILMQPIVDFGGKAGVVLSGGLIGAFGISDAAVAQLKMMHSMFGELVTSYGVNMIAWAAALVVGSRVTSFIYPGANMFSSMGFAESKDIKSILYNGWIVSVAHCVLLVIYAFAFS